MQIASPTFVNNNPIPLKYSCKGDNISPPLVISDVPAEAKSLALIVHDPDSPSGSFIHWVLWNIDPTITNILEATPPVGAGMGVNDFGQQAYGGPCPHSGRHRYVFNVFALDSMLDLPENSNGPDVNAALQPHIIAKARLVGTFGA